MEKQVGSAPVSGLKYSLVITSKKTARVAQEARVLGSKSDLSSDVPPSSDLAAACREAIALDSTFQLEAT